MRPLATPSQDSRQTPLLTARGIGKSFFGIPVLRDVSLTLHRGETIGLVGENGAGKSTLMNLLGGNLQPDAGSFILADEAYAPHSPRDAERRGIAFVHQELNLFPNLSIAENLFIGDFPRPFRGWPFIDGRAMRRRAHELLEEVGLKLSPSTLVERLSAGERQLVEIARALGRQARVLILDEPTTSLSARETSRLFELLAKLRARGLATIYISHNLSHVLQLADSLVVLRDGANVGSGPRSEFTVDRLVTLMVGRPITQFFPPRASTRKDEIVLEARGLAQPGIVRNIHFQLRAGEILGLSGLMGSGRSELARILFGLDPCQTGELFFGGQPIHSLAPNQRIMAGLAFLTEDRRGDGLCLESSIEENIVLAGLRRFSTSLWSGLDQRAAHTHARRVREAVKLTASASDAQSVSTLSGGNQQKVVLAKWLLNEPRVFILDEPTRGIDVGAKFEIYRLIHQLAERGAGILMISSEVEELIGTCDRILVMNQGALREELSREEFDRERILRASLHEEVVV